MKEEKRRGLLTEHEINEKYKNAFTYQTSRYDGKPRFVTIGFHTMFWVFCSEMCNAGQE